MVGRAAFRCLNCLDSLGCLGGCLAPWRVPSSVGTAAFHPPRRDRSFGACGGGSPACTGGLMTEISSGQLGPSAPERPERRRGGCRWNVDGAVLARCCCGARVGLRGRRLEMPTCRWLVSARSHTEPRTHFTPPSLPSPPLISVQEWAWASRTADRVLPPCLEIVPLDGNWIAPNSAIRHR
jgi:hypothetical protein